MMTNNFQISSREWWVERWLELLNSYRFKKRLERGRNYAREGNVLNIEFAGAQVLAQVQGSEAEPYQVSLSIEPFTDEDWNYIIATMSEKAIFSAQLLAGEMPANIEEVFTTNGLSLFPFSLADIRSRCSCPDKANPCKHIAAVYYQLGDRFSEDPFVLFQLRGRTKTQILDGLRQLRSREIHRDSDEFTTNFEPATTKSSAAEKETSITEERTLINKYPALIDEVQAGSVTSRRSPSDIKDFWHYNEPLESSLVVITPPIDSKNVLDLLGKIPLTATDADAFEQFLAQVYQTASQKAIASALKPNE
ncbi:SWIM zinc finger family protein [Pleurocapsales cyanobacterium LEGE 06147]|nr:SWIM zinc finger family protein [Pleurocapsales cyanobacterium LEGE 06147]